MTRIENQECQRIRIFTKKKTQNFKLPKWAVKFLNSKYKSDERNFAGNSVRENWWSARY